MRINIHPSSVGPILRGGPNPDSIGILSRGRSRRFYHTYIVFKLDEEIQYRRVVKTHDHICVMHFSDLSEGSHFYQTGYFTVSPVHQFDKTNFVWNNVEKHIFNISFSEPLDFIFASSMRYIPGPINFGTKKGDEIFKTIGNIKNIQFILHLGDKFVYDSLGPLCRKRSVSQMRRLNRTVYNMRWYRNLHTFIPSYDICDDRDLHVKNAGQISKFKHSSSFKNGLKVYREYRHHLGPIHSISEPLYYTFERNNSHFFVFDTRTEREELSNNRRMVSNTQLKAFKHWIRDSEKADKYKFIVSSVPVVSHPGQDKWSGYPVQQRKLLEIVLGKNRLGNPIRKAIFLCGDSKCCRASIYDVSDRYGVTLGNVTEIISSGLNCVKHGKGKQFTKFTELERYDENNDFPHIVDNTFERGLKFTTRMSSMTFPNPHKPVKLLDKLRKPFIKVIDSVFVRILEIEDKLCVRIYNQYQV